MSTTTPSPKMVKYPQSAKQQIAQLLKTETQKVTAQILNIPVSIVRRMANEINDTVEKKQIRMVSSKKVNTKKTRKQTRSDENNRHIVNRLNFKA
jgi:hypothetical protein